MSGLVGAKVLVIRAVIGDGAAYDMKIGYSDETTPLGTAGRSRTSSASSAATS
jgi:NDP-sugar pyrophosphorylase family protein